MEAQNQNEQKSLFDIAKLMQLFNNQDFIDSMIKVIQAAEDTHKRPVCHFDIFQASLQFKDIKIPLNAMMVNFFITTLFNKELIYANQAINFFSLKPLPGMKKLSGFIAATTDYELDTKKIIFIPKEGTPMADMHEVYQLLLSKDFNDEEVSSKLQGDEKLLKSDGLTEPKVAFATFPRCGNTFLKKYLQEVTNMACGDDVGFPATMKYQTLFNGLIGSGLCGDQTWLSLTHHPLRMGPFEIFKAQMALGLVRNPLDVFNSQFLMMATSSFDVAFEGDYHQDLKEDWENAVLNGAQSYLDYHLSLMKECKEKNVPIYIARYEDLIDNLEGELKGIFEYLLGTNTLDGTYAMKRIQHLVNENKGGVSVYTKKYATYNANAHRFSAELIQKIKEILKPLIIYFGYVKHPKSQKDCSTFDFFQFNEEEVTEEEWQNYCGFKDLNTQNKEYRVTKKEEIFKHSINFNGEGCNVKMHPPTAKDSEKYLNIKIKIPADIQKIKDAINEDKKE